MMSLALLAFCSPALLTQEPQATTVQEEVVTVLTDATDNDGAGASSSSANLGGGSANSYCLAGVNSFNTQCFISYSGSLDLANNSFTLVATGAAAIPNSWGFFNYGTSFFTTTPFGNGYLCVAPFGSYKMPTQHLGNGNVFRSMADFPQNFQLFTPGSTWYYQFWYRDPPAGGAYFNLSDGLHVVFAPGL